MLKRNIPISYFLAFSKNTWFWLGTWVFYYLRFTNYAGIGIIETILIVTFTVTEIPTGAIADLFGRKKTLILSFFLEAFAGVVMAMATNFNMLAISVFILCIGGTLYSGTIDSLVFDSLKEVGDEDIYDKKISNMRTISLVTPAVCGILGGFMYRINPAMPYYANVIGYMLGLVACFYLVEPQIDSETFSLKNFGRQMKLGIGQLFKNDTVRKNTMLLLSIGFFVVIAWEMLDSFLGIEFGFNEIEMGVLFSVVYFVSAMASQLTPFIKQILSERLGIILIGIFVAVTFMISPVLGLILGGVSIALRSSLQGIFENLVSITINKYTESKYRATTISSFNMIKNIPYVLGAYFIGLGSDKFTARTIALYLGVALLILIVLQVVASIKPAKRDIIGI